MNRTSPALLLVLALAFIGCEADDPNHRLVGQLESDRVEITADYAATLEKAGRLDDAIEACRRAIELEPEVGRYHHQLAVLLERAGRTEEARAQFEKASKLGVRN